MYLRAALLLFGTLYTVVHSASIGWPSTPQTIIVRVPIALIANEWWMMDSLSIFRQPTNDALWWSRANFERMDQWLAQAESFLMESWLCWQRRRQLLPSSPMIRFLKGLGLIVKSASHGHPKPHTFTSTVKCVFAPVPVYTLWGLIGFSARSRHRGTICGIMSGQYLVSVSSEDLSASIASDLEIRCPWCEEET